MSGHIGYGSGTVPSFICAIYLGDDSDGDGSVQAKGLLDVIKVYGVSWTIFLRPGLINEGI